MKDCRASNIDIITFGQYLRPSKNHLPVKRFVEPKEFDEWKKIGEEMGFRYVASGAMIRSSYRAGGNLMYIFVMSRILSQEFGGGKGKALLPLNIYFFS